MCPRRLAPCSIEALKYRRRLYCVVAAHREKSAQNREAPSSYRNIAICEASEMQTVAEAIKRARISASAAIQVYEQNHFLRRGASRMRGLKKPTCARARAKQHQAL